MGRILEARGLVKRYKDAEAVAGVDLTVGVGERVALLVTSHNMTDVERVCDRVVFLARGRVVADGPPTDVAEAFGQANLEEVFLHLASGQPDPEGCR